MSTGKQYAYIACRRFFVRVSVGLACLMLAGSLLGGSVEAQQDTIRTVPDTLLTQRPNTLEQDLVGNRLLDASFPGSWGIPGSNSRVRIFGFVKADYLQDFRPNTNLYEFTIPTIPLEGTPEANRRGRTNLHAKSSRVGVEFRSITKENKPLHAMVSFDTFHDDPSEDNFFRLRMAYVVYDKLLAGQTWSTFADLTALIYTLDFEGGDALIGDRVPQFRYTDQIKDHWTWAAAIEAPLGKAKIVDAGGSAGLSQPNTPEFVGRIRWQKGRNHVQLTGLANRLRWVFDDGSGAATALKYGGNFTGLFVFGKGQREMVSFGLAGGRGLASWSPTTSAEPLDAVLLPNDELETLPFLEYNVGFRHNWTPKLTSAITWAHNFVSLNDLQDPGTLREGGSFHVNLMWYPIKSSDKVLTGIEYIWGYWETMDGRRGVADRVQISLKWQFNP